MCLRELVLMLFIIAPVARSESDSNLENLLTQESCQLVSNSTLEQQFQSSIRSQYPNATSDLNPNRYTVWNVNNLNKVKCYTTCARVTLINVTWCVHVYHPAGEVKACFNNSGVIGQTPLAATLGLGAQFSICDPLGGLCSSYTPSYLNRAYLVCTVRTNACSGRTFIQVGVVSSKPSVRITHVPISPTNIILGTRAVLQCSATASSVQGLIQWSTGDVIYYPIREDPYCASNCSVDRSPFAMIASLNRIRTYLISDWTVICGGNLLNMISYLVIDNVTEDDGGLYYCNASTKLVDATISASIFLVVVSPPPLNNTTLSAAIPTVAAIGTSSTMLPATSASLLAIWISLPPCIFFALVTILAVTLLAILRKKGRITKRIDARNIVIAEQEFYAFTQESYYLQKDIQAAQIREPDPWEFPRENLTIQENKLLGKGEFGKVYKGQAVGIIPETPERNVVAVKMCKDSAPPQEIRDLYDEIELMKKLEPHENILNLLGYCSTPDGPLYVIIEFAMHGSLRSFLNSCEEAVLKLNHQPIITRKRSRIGSSSSTSSTHHLLSSRVPTSGHTPSDSQMHFIFPPTQVNNGPLPEEYRVAHAGMMTTPFAHTVAPISNDYVNCRGLIQMEDVQNFALQIASGLKHLENMNVVHCDLAARNILIAEGFVLKISDFGMARDISGKEYYRKSPKGRVPVKWTAPEALEEHLYTFKSDVWSFAVVLWEIFTYGHSPYPDIEIQVWEHFIQFLKEGNRPPLPPGCPENIYEIMHKCWKLNPDERPSASDLMDMFIPKSDELSLTPQDGCMQLEQLQEDPERYIEN